MTDTPISSVCVCDRCGALIFPTDGARQLHIDFHAAIDRQAEHKAEQREPA